MIFNIERYIVKRFNWLAHGNRPGNSFTFFLREFTREHFRLVSAPDEWIAARQLGSRASRPAHCQRGPERLGHRTHEMRLGLRAGINAVACGGTFQRRSGSKPWTGNRL